MSRSPLRADVRDSVSARQERRILMDWVNSLDVDSCMLASGVEDLKEGAVLCDIACHVTNRSLLQQVRRGRPGGQLSQADSLHNLGLFLRSFQDFIPDELRMSAEELYEDADALYRVLRLWANQQDPAFVSASQGPPPPRSHPSLQLPSPRPPASNFDPTQEGLRRLPEKPKPLLRTPIKSLDNPTPTKEASMFRDEKPITPMRKDSLPIREEQPLTPAMETRPLNRTPATRRPQTEETPLKPVERPPRPMSGSEHKRQTAHTAETEMPLKPPRQSGLEVVPVSEVTKERLFVWLQGLNLVRKSVKIEDLAGLCTNGVLFCDLLNRLEGRTEVIKGVERNPKNRTSVQANFAKALAYLRSFDKMNSRYLWALADLMAGVEDVIWGLIEDIKVLFKAKLVSLDAAVASSVPTAQRSRSISKDKSSSVTPSGAVSSRYEGIPTSPKTFRLPPRTPSSRPPEPVEPSRLESKPVALDFQPVPITKEMEGRVKQWISGLKLSHLLGHENKHYLVDPLKNGVLICELVSTLEKTRMQGVNKAPGSAQSVRENVEKALCILRERKLNLPLPLLRQGEKIAQGNSKLTWNLLWALMAAYPEATQEPLEAPEPRSELPYSQMGLKRLEQSLVNWVYSLGVSGRAICPADLNEILTEIRNGVLLCDLVAKVLPVNIPGVFRGPKSDSIAASNVRKALEPLRRASRMSQAFVWKEKEIGAGDVVAILGLLEDLHRYSDGLPPRKRGPDYHKDGPYLGRQYSYAKAASAIPAERPIETAREPPRRQPSLSLAEDSIDAPRRFRLNSHEGSDHSFAQKLGSPAHFQSDRPSIDLGRGFELTDERLFQWLDSIGIRYPAGLTLSQPEELRNGVLFCQIVETLSKSPLKGYTMHPRTTAAALNNVKKFLYYMRTDANFPSKLFFVEEDVIRGDSETIRELLGEVYRRFRQSIRNSIRISERVMKRAASESSFRSPHNRSVS